MNQANIEVKFLSYLPWLLVVVGFIVYRHSPLRGSVLFYRPSDPGLDIGGTKPPYLLNHHLLPVAPTVQISCEAMRNYF